MGSKSIPGLVYFRDELADLRSQLVITDPQLIYSDSYSLGDCCSAGNDLSPCLSLKIIIHACF
jgi:hypothetical protein